jgi:hypothetical protein
MKSDDLIVRSMKITIEELRRMILEDIGTDGLWTAGMCGGMGMGKMTAPSGMNADEDEMELGNKDDERNERVKLHIDPTSMDEPSIEFSDEESLNKAEKGHIRGKEGIPKQRA